MFFITDSDILAGVDQNHQIIGIMRSTDKGKTWMLKRRVLRINMHYVSIITQKVEIYAGTAAVCSKLKSRLYQSKKYSPLNDIKIYPNPASEYINLPEFSGEIRILDFRVMKLCP